MTLSHLNFPATYPPAEKLFRPPAPSVMGTGCLIAGLLIASNLCAIQSTSEIMAHTVAIPVGIALLISFYCDALKGLRNLFRVDVLCLICLYGLTLAEFLFPQPDFNLMVTPTQTKAALDIVLLGIGSLALGRHLVEAKPMRSGWLTLGDISHQSLFRVFVISAFLAYFYIFLSAHFNPIVVIQSMMNPRFSQPWSRGALGGWSSLLIELNLLSYILPPLTALIWNRRQHFAKWQLAIVAIIFSITIFYGFASGTRNIFIAYLATFLAAYLVTLPKNNFRNTVIPIVLTIMIAGYGSYHMLEFRGIGLRNYVIQQAYAPETTRDTLAVDYNLAPLGRLTEVIPKKHDFLGTEVLSWAIAKPIPRVFWPGKPVGLSISIEEIVGADGWTVAATYLGESYMMAGMAGVVVVSLFLGALAAWWNRMAMRMQSDYGLLVYAMGFFAAAITMRSLFWMTTAILPVIALIVFRKCTSVR